MGKHLLSVGDAEYGFDASLEQLRQHYCCLFALKARVSPREWRKMLTGADGVETFGLGPVDLPSVDWKALVVRLLQRCSAPFS